MLGRMNVPEKLEEICRIVAKAAPRPLNYVEAAAKPKSMVAAAKTSGPTARPGTSHILVMASTFENHTSDQVITKLRGVIDARKIEFKRRVAEEALNILFTISGQQLYKDVLESVDRLEELQEEISTNFSVATDLSSHHFELLKDKVIKKVQPMLSTESECRFKFKNKLPAKDISGKQSEIFALIPHRGVLELNETNYVQVVFKPEENISVKAILECETLGGPTEIITITGKSSDLHFELNTRKLNFKIREFYRSAVEVIKLYNTSPLPFDYTVYLNEAKDGDSLAARIVSVTPYDKLLQPYEEVNIQVLVKPGLTGYFNCSFMLEVGYLPHLTIELEGWGVIPQVYLSLPRSHVKKMSHELCYQAVASLTSSFLNAINELFEKKYSVPLNSPVIDRCFEDPELQEEWHICSIADEYPTVMDIELAIERILFVKHIQKCPEIMVNTSENQTEPITDFSTMPYVIDYGVVIIDCKAQCVVEVVNYGPVHTKLRLSKRSVLPRWLDVTPCPKLAPGTSANVNIVLSPTAREFPEVEQAVETSFHFEVPCGVRIPVTVRAICAVPYLVCNVANIDFGKVRCGDKVTISMPLRNVGKATCIWYATLSLKAPTPCPIIIHNGSGMFRCGDGSFIKLSFTPVREMRYEGSLIFKFHMNPDRLILPITGYGIRPRVHIIGPHINFPATLPFCSERDIYFGLTNPCAFPIELIFPHTDVKWKEEEEIVELLNTYYDRPDEILLPKMTPGAGFPPALVNFIGI
ncbi:Hydrocephalus-inducing protein homolog [Eumeta japonica]|uniref:Hydrocephalus-inducing protein homolog n=1 Tax=Eumeta variegata TaxID=151549 RepID=A0A4C1YNK2_EUMVA|nr:Hydrocephalus-inducing protein homolog [Eumeta japonica]